MKRITVKDLMTPHPVLIDPFATLAEAATLMKKYDCGALPVVVDGKPEGIITDRDIVLRTLAVGGDPMIEKVWNCMTPHAYSCRDDDFLEDAIEKMHQCKVGRLVVKNKKGETVGILSLGGILRKEASVRDLTATLEHAEGKKSHVAW